MECGIMVLRHMIQEVVGDSQLRGFRKNDLEVVLRT